MQWDSEELYLKAKLYIDRANEFDHASSEFPFWSALSLELLARSALAKVHPALNADPRQDNNLLYAFGYDIPGQPRSLPAHAVYLRVEKIVPGFGKVQRELCDYIALLRNREVHSADLPFEDLKESSWLPRFYEVCKILCEYLEYTLAEFLEEDIATSALKLIDTLNKELEARVKTKLAEHKKLYDAMPAPEKKELREAAAARLKLLQLGLKKQTCPACGNLGALRGDLIKELRPEYKDETLYIDQEYLASEFKCLVCELGLPNLEEISHASIEPRFIQTRETDLHELSEPDYYDDYMNM